MPYSTNDHLTIGRPATCPLCAASDVVHFHTDWLRDYFRCNTCLLVFVPREQHLNWIEQKAIYDLHDNDPNNEGYRAFLSRLADPLRERLPAGASGLDYGCGPGPALSAMLSEQGFPTAVFDPIYAKYPEALQQRYDFICCSEVVEHFTEPGIEFDRLFSLLKPQGWLGIMTKRVIDREAFSRWHYKNDPTHVSFFSEPTFRWLAARYRCRLEFVGKDVAFLQRSNRHQ